MLPDITGSSPQNVALANATRRVNAKGDGRVILYSTPYGSLPILLFKHLHNSPLTRLAFKNLLAVRIVRVLIECHSMCSEEFTGLLHAVESQFLLQETYGQFLVTASASITGKGAVLISVRTL